MTPEIWAWACVNRRGDIIVNSVAPTRQESIRKLVDASGLSWRWYYFRGCRCWRVNIRVHFFGKANPYGD